MGIDEVGIDKVGIDKVGRYRQDWTAHHSAIIYSRVARPHESLATLSLAGQIDAVHV